MDAFLDSITPDLPDIARVLAAALLALPLGWQREKVERSAGIRTYPLVAITCCIFLLVGKSAVAGLDAVADSYARLIAGVMTGLGFLGGGAILKLEKSVKGTATATTLWGTGSLGVACAFDRFDLAILISILMFLSLTAFKPIKESVNGDEPDEEK